MRTSMQCTAPQKTQPCRSDCGFSLMEFMLSSLVLLVVAASSFAILTQTERTADTQTQVQAVTDNARIAMETVTRFIQQAGNDPKQMKFTAITIGSATEVRVRSDLTGSTAAVSPDTGDPDGDLDDAGEDVVIRHNAQNRTIELVVGWSVQPVACNISAFSIRYFDRTGGETDISANVTRLRIALTATSPVADPQTGDVFSMPLESEIQIASR